MSLTDTLLQLDANKVAEKPTKEIEIKRLSRLAGKKVMFKCQALDGQTYGDIQRMSIDISKKGNLQDLKIFEMQLMTCIEGTIDPNLKDQKLLDHYNASTPKELVRKMLLPGEISDLYNIINELSGYESDEDEEEVKNS
uniref:Tail assembly chaperone protein n=1 Tax=Siphoviridae sp. ctOb14 TaxID=2827862 RepID=A0A8S5SLR6_9CAUD|nr:MAG TPA: tail assembly chaperone protein [Siphoviridae sp. ctOb14]